jgi:hypothetical protein
VVHMGFGGMAHVHGPGSSFSRRFMPMQSPRKYMLGTTLRYKWGVGCHPSMACVRYYGLRARASAILARTVR